MSYKNNLDWREKNRERYLKYKRDWARKKYKENKEFREKINKKERDKYNEDQEYREFKKKLSKKWVENNKERHNKLMKKDYEKNKDKWNLRKTTAYRKKELFNYHNNKCKNCGLLKNLQIHHKTYNITKGIKGYVLTEELKKKTELLCRQCHRELHKK